tara:strand:- start:1417 stop:1806 length:390 start_codon:yes stop_codon:yes gene_type:complete
MSKRTNKIINEVIEQIVDIVSTKYGIKPENIRKDIKDIPKNLECQYIINEKTGTKCGVVLCTHHKKEIKEKIKEEIKDNNGYFPEGYSNIYKELDDVIQESIMFSNIDSVRRRNNMPTLGFSEKYKLDF